ncbi:hypothetical protein E2I00_012033 [Balaenoptera physalus]|uniref:Uncharacterized protein n=1 Tax=Balaenoptera physalus TaxID=9770 RepID=A0A6A1QDY0_BALPH|nr:hypothetical protein E2I00_012033 [Balaenoptera physalus]
MVSSTRNVATSSLEGSRNLSALSSPARYSAAVLSSAAATVSAVLAAKTRKSFYLACCHSDSSVLTPSTFYRKSRKQWHVHGSGGISQLGRKAAPAQGWGHLGTKGRAHSRGEANADVCPLQPGHQVKQQRL